MAANKAAGNDLLNALQGLSVLGALLQGNGSTAAAPTAPAKKERDFSNLLPLDEAGAIKVTLTQEEMTAMVDAFSEQKITKAGKKTFRFVQEDGKPAQVQVYVKKW